MLGEQRFCFFCSVLLSLRYVIVEVMTLKQSTTFCRIQCSTLTTMHSRLQDRHRWMSLGASTTVEERKVVRSNPSPELEAQNCSPGWPYVCIYRYTYDTYIHVCMYMYVRIIRIIRIDIRMIRTYMYVCMYVSYVYLYIHTHNAYIQLNFDIAPFKYKSTNTDTTPEFPQGDDEDDVTSTRFLKLYSLRGRVSIY